MSFGAMTAWQAALLVAAAIGVAAWLFFLKVRPPRVAVPSLLLWRRVLERKGPEYRQVARIPFDPSMN